MGGCACRSVCKCARDTIFFRVCVHIFFDPVSVNRHCNKDLPLEGMDSAPGFTGLAPVTKRKPVFNYYSQVNKTFGNEYGNIPVKTCI